MEGRSSRIDEALEALGRVDDVVGLDERTAQDQIMAMEGDLIDYFHSWYSEDETDSIMREWRVNHSIGGTALGG